MSISDPYTRRLHECVDRIEPGLFANLDNIETVATIKSLELLRLLIDFACKSQNINAIRAAHHAFNKIPRTWLKDNISQAVESSVDMTDEWEFRRLLELLHALVPDLELVYVEKGLSSENNEVKEAAAEFIKDTSENS